MLAREFGATHCVRWMPVPSSRTNVARTCTGALLGLASRKNVSKRVAAAPKTPCWPSANAHLLTGAVTPAVAWPSRQGKVGELGSAADGVPQYMARSATIGAVAVTRMPKAADVRRESKVRPSWSTHTVKRSRARSG